VTFPTPTLISEDLITANLGLARQSAWRFHRKTGQAYEELEAIAFVGLIRGCRRYDPDRLNPGTGKPYALSTIVVPFIQGEILHWFRDRGFAMKFPTKWREQWGKVQRLMADPDLSAQDVAEQCGLSMADLTEMLAAMTTVSATLTTSTAPTATTRRKWSCRGSTRSRIWCSRHGPTSTRLIAGCCSAGGAIHGGWRILLERCSNSTNG
jgi:DNA-directed RNA polymerase specialized sigma subunit